MAEQQDLKGKRFFPFIAPPNGGKGTQTGALLKTYPDKLSKVDMGALLREAAADESNPLGQKIRDAQKAGKLVDIDIVIGVLEEGLTKAARKNPNVTGFILDGFPRNIEQLDKLLDMCNKVGADLAKAFYLKFEDPQTLIDRAAGRVFHKPTGNVYNLRIAGFHPPGFDPGTTDEKTFLASNPDYYQRDDDKEEVVRKRLESFKADTQPMIDKLDGMGLLTELNGDRKPEAITEELLLNMENYLKEPQPGLSKTLGILLALAVPLAIALLMKVVRV